jgi:thiol-disulfide isomerase/thioredoxin
MGFVSAYSYIKNNNKGTIRDNLLAHHLHFFLEAPHIYQSFDSLLLDFKNVDKKGGYTNYLEDLLAKKKKEIEKNKSVDDALNSIIIDSASVKNTLNFIFKNKPVVIDCWASWCGPCIAQLPYSNQLEKKYGKKVDFVYLSFDRNSVLWKAKIKDLKLSHHCYMVSNGFQSDFAQHFNITSIPRYLVFDKNGKMVDANAPRPSDNKFKSLLNKLLAE